MSDQIEKLFREARRADEASVPPFESMRRAARRPRSRVFRVAFATTFAGLALAATVWRVVRDEVPPPPPEPELEIRPVVRPGSPGNEEHVPPPPPAPMESNLRAAAERLAGSTGQEIPVPHAYFQKVSAEGVQDADGEGKPSVRHYSTVVGGVSMAGPDVSSEPFNTERYDVINENRFLAVVDNPLSTFSIDVDTASYANVRRFIEQGVRPPKNAVRIEELINYFDYDYPLPAGDAPFSADVEVADCPWNPKHRLARIGLKGREVDRGWRAGSNLVFLIDVSGSMQSPKKLPLLKSALALLVQQLDGRDQLAIVVYAGSSGLVLPSTPGNATGEILAALNRLQAGGSTNGGSGLRLAYQVARENFIPGGVNRVVLATDGDFNVGVTDSSELLDLIRQDADRGIFLTTLGFGMGNYQDATLQTIADKGNGNYAYIDRLQEAHKVLVEEIGGTLVTIARDVKIQVEFNPTEVGAYRLIGYENRMLAKEDFNDDTRDAGEIGAGHTVTALYELVPPQEMAGLSSIDALKYQSAPAPTEAAGGGELFTLKLRYKEPEGGASKLLSFPVVDEGLSLGVASEDFKFAAAVAIFGMVLRDSPYRGAATLDDARNLSMQGLGADARGYRGEFEMLVGRAIALMDSE